MTLTVTSVHNINCTTKVIHRKHALHTHTLGLLTRLFADAQHGLSRMLKCRDDGKYHDIFEKSKTSIFLIYISILMYIRYLCDM